jgi:hypothetical protein
MVTPESPVDTSPTYFGPAESPLFGVVHHPADGRVRGAVLVCGSLGMDHFDSLRGLRLVGDALAARGMLVLRFDYLGCGDSSFGQVRPNSVAEWQASIGYAIDYLKGAGIDDLSAVGVRAGCLLLDAALRETHALRRVVYWDPMGAGRRFLREQTAFFKIAAGEDQVPDGVVSMIGARLSAQAAKEFGALKLREPPTDQVAERLIISRTEGADPGVTAQLDVARTDSVLLDGLSECAQPTRMLTPVALGAIDASVAWLDERVPVQTQSASPAIANTARIAVDDGQTVTERVERIGPHGLFAIRSLPDSDAVGAEPRPTVMFFTNANNPHYGPNREWVDLSRSAALLGGHALRFDRRGAGESGPASRDGAVYIYSDAGIEDARAAALHAAKGASRLQFAGVCSGGWYAACGGVAVGADSVVLVNELLWSLRIKKALREPSVPGDKDGIDWEQSPRARLRRSMQAHIPASAWRQLGRIGVAQAPEVLLAQLARKGSNATVILCPDDAKLFRANRGWEALERLRSSAAPPHVVEVAAGDHASFHQAVLVALRQVVAGFVKDVDTVRVNGHTVQLCGP